MTTPTHAEERLCANGDGRPIQPPSKVICRECMEKIRQAYHWRSYSA
jgi:hypothetical protein